MITKRQYDFAGRVILEELGGSRSHYWDFETVETGTRLLIKLTASPFRSLSRDPIEEKGGANLYEFLINDPLGLVDPLGQDKYPCTENCIALEKELAAKCSQAVSSCYSALESDAGITIGCVAICCGVVAPACPLCLAGCMGTSSVCTIVHVAKCMKIGRDCQANKKKAVDSCFEAAKRNGC